MFDYDPKEFKILIVDDDTLVLEGLRILLEDSYSLVDATSGAQSIELVQADHSIAVVVMDIKMPQIDGIETARRLREIAPDIPIIFHTGFSGEYDEDRIDADEHPYQYIQKGGSPSQLVRAVRNALDSYVAKTEVSRLSSLAETAFGMIGSSGVMQVVYDTIRRVAPQNVKVMILGETGTGKELVARAIHNLSARRDNKLAIFSCNHKAPDLVESELFGHKKGSFTGALSDRIGLFEYADGGTVFLDEIGDLDITTQAKLLRVLEAGEIQTVGDTPELMKVDVRVICATHHDLKQLVDDRKFREDLYYRLKGITITVPPLRERRQDIPKLASRFMDRLTIENNQPPVFFDSKAMRTLVDFDWPGNVRQLLDTIESLIVLSDSSVIMAQDVEKYLGISNATDPVNGHSHGLASRTLEFRKSCIIEALHHTKGNVNAAARHLDVDPANLRKWIKLYDI